MPQIGWFELLIVVLIAILVIGPKDFPVVLKKIGQWIGSTKRYFSDIQQKVNETVDVEESVKVSDEQIYTAERFINMVIFIKKPESFYRSLETLLKKS